jgi:hypothetical protein
MKEERAEHVSFSQPWCGRQDDDDDDDANKPRSERDCFLRDQSLDGCSVGIGVETFLPYSTLPSPCFLGSSSGFMVCVAYVFFAFLCLCLLLFILVT